MVILGMLCLDSTFPLLTGGPFQGCGDKQHRTSRGDNYKLILTLIDKIMMIFSYRLWVWVFGIKMIIKSKLCELSSSIIRYR